MAEFDYGWECTPVFSGRTEYGLPNQQYLHFVVATGSDGSRWAHFHGEMSPDPVCPTATNRILQSMIAREPDPRTSDFWSETNPVAGSPADLLLQEDEDLINRIEDERFGVMDYLSRPTRFA